MWYEDGSISFDRRHVAAEFRTTLPFCSTTFV